MSIVSKFTQGWRNILGSDHPPLMSTRTYAEPIRPIVDYEWRTVGIDQKTGLRQQKKVDLYVPGTRYWSTIARRTGTPDAFMYQLYDIAFQTTARGWGYSQPRDPKREWLITTNETGKCLFTKHGAISALVQREQYFGVRYPVSSKHQNEGPHYSRFVSSAPSAPQSAITVAQSSQLRRTPKASVGVS